MDLFEGQYPLHTSPDVPLIHNESLNLEDAHAYGMHQEIKEHAPLTPDWINQISLRSKDMPH